MNSLIERGECPMRHENGNCMPAGGFCTAVNDPICEALCNAYHCGLHDAFETVSKHLYGERRKDTDEPSFADLLFGDLEEIIDATD